VGLGVYDLAVLDTVVSRVDAKRDRRPAGVILFVPVDTDPVKHQTTGGEVVVEDNRGVIRVRTDGGDPVVGLRFSTLCSSTLDVDVVVGNRQRALVHPWPQLDTHVVTGDDPLDTSSAFARGGCEDVVVSQGVVCCLRLGWVTELVDRFPRRRIRVVPEPEAEVMGQVRLSVGR
jgi:hypothetical protein